MDCNKGILDFLSVECMPVTLYRMRKFIDTRPRLLKIVMLNSFFAHLLLRRTHRLNAFSEPRVFTTPLFKKAESVLELVDNL